MIQLINDIETIVSQLNNPPSAPNDLSPLLLL